MSIRNDIILYAGLAATAAALTGIYYSAKNKKNRKKRSIWVNPYLKNRATKGRFAMDFDDMVAHEKTFIENFHMNVDTFNTLFNKVESQLLSYNSREDIISPKLKFAAVIEYLASGSIQRHIASIYRISSPAFGHILNDVCDAICNVLVDDIPIYSTSSFIQKANNYNYRWNFPNCVGSIDGKHIAIRKPKAAGSMFFNYKLFHSIVLMAVADADYSFSYIDVGAYGSEGDANIFTSSLLGNKLLGDLLPFPKDATVGSKKIPYFFIADDAFPLDKRIMKPYVPRKPQKLNKEERIFNYRLSRARRCVENAFGILCAKWLCLSRTMFCQPDRAQKIARTCCYLHNYLLKINKSVYCPSKYADRFDTTTGVLIEGEWRKCIPDNSLFHSNITASEGRPKDEPKLIRNNIKDYVNSMEGSITWQNESAFV